ncbi:MAG: RnfH family protein [Candidatus Zeuxoniibacter abyssi]|nr:MAG: RnfH family protein [Candidatus Persebacteraceae bacterium AB1(2)]
MTIHRVVISSYPACDMFALVDEIELYPDFLPWCEKTQVTRNDDEVRATVFINYHGLRTSFSTKNRHQPPDKIDMALTKGPLSSLSGGWRFIDLGDGRSRVEFDLTYRFANRLFAKTFEKLFEKFFGHFVDTFIVRAREKYGVAGRGKIRVQVVDAESDTPWQCDIDLPNGATLGDALAVCGRGNAASVGVWGKPSGHSRPLNSGDRVEVYRPLANDPREARRRKSRRT